MAITNRDQLIAALASTRMQFVFDKAASAGSGAGLYSSYWRSIGTPAQGAVPGAAATCNHTTTGTFTFAQATGGAKTYLGAVEFSLSAANSFEIHDRLAHMGGLNGTLATAQTVSLDLNSLLGTDNITERIGASNCSEVQWFLEWYTATGAAAVTATVNVTYSGGTTGNLSAISLAATRPIGFAVCLNAFVPSGVGAVYIRGVNTVTLSATTGTAGNFGVTATKPLFSYYCALASSRYLANWADTGLDQVPNSACLTVMCFHSSTSSSAIKAIAKLAQG